MAEKRREYTGTVYIASVGGDLEPGQSRDSIENLARRTGDSRPVFVRATKGYEARQTHLNNFISKTTHDFILLLDHDMVFPVDTLERLRRHKLPYISGLYLRRTYAPMGPVWYRPFNGKQFPMEPWMGSIERGRLHEIGASGWGCILLHREVILAVRALLHGEWEVLEDDMDIYPYDLAAIMGAIRGLRTLADEKPSLPTLRPALEHHTSVLEQQIRPLRADREPVGSDIRFPFFARLAGFKMYGDPDVRPGHVLYYPLSPDDYDGAGPEYHGEQYKAMHRRVLDERRQLRKQKAALYEQT